MFVRFRSCKCDLLALCLDCRDVMYDDAMQHKRTPYPRKIQGTFASLASALVPIISIKDEDIALLHKEYSIPNLRAPYHRHFIAKSLKKGCKSLTSHIKQHASSTDRTPSRRISPKYPPIQ